MVKELIDGSSLKEKLIAAATDGWSGDALAIGIIDAQRIADEHIATLERIALDLDIEATWHVPGSHCGKRSPPGLFNKLQGFAKRIRDEIGVKYGV